MIAALVALQVAVTVPSLPQIDLKAGYCAGRLRNILPFTDQQLMVMGEVGKRSNEQLESAKARLRAYLLPRLDDVGNADGIIAAMKVGEREQAVFENQVDRCVTKDGFAASCARTVPHEKLTECRKADFLPF